MDMKDMLLESASGFMMPFAAAEDEEVQVSLGFGQQKHPMTGEQFVHRGVDFIAHDVPLFALATGAVVGIGTDAVHDHYMIIKYGKYEVKYGHISRSFVSYGMPVYAGLQVAQSGDFLHFEVSQSGEVLDPTEFLGMVYGNIQQLDAMGIKGCYRLANMGVKVQTDYDADQDELLQMMLRWWPVYMNEIRLGSYVPPARVEQSLRNIFAQSANRNHFFETIPQIGNPLGLSSRGAPLASKVQNLLIGDFLSYMALRHQVYLSSWDDDEKKKLLSRQQPTDC
ncbi:MAG: M23 family metallopeptidase [Prevotella sp.]|nr:M23 family metallopeptidase [Prevotella sp.]